jgi:hypothetical protein
MLTEAQVGDVGRTGEPDDLDSDIADEGSGHRG